MIINDLKHLLLVCTYDTILQFEVVVIAFQFQYGIFTHITYHVGYVLVSLERDGVAAFCEKMLGIFQILAQ